MSRRDRQSRPRRRYHPEASYDEASRARYRVRSQRPGGSGSGGSDHGISVTRRVLFAGLGIAAARLAWLQLVDGPSLAEKAEAQRTNRVTLHARRGTIYDRNGNVLAMSEECSTIYANPEVITDPSGVADALVSVLKGKKSDYLPLLTQDTTFVYIKKQVDQELADKLSDLLRKRELTGIYFLEDTKRVYPYGTTGAQVLGYVGSEGQGLSGLEYYYDDLLTGVDGEMIVETGLYGTPIAGGVSQVTEAQDGTDIVISLDIDLQQACEAAIVPAIETYSADSGSVMVTDPCTGEILAACSTPLPDFSDLEDASALNLKLVSSSFEPGSIFKVLTTSIGMELGLFTPDTSYGVPAAYKVGDSYVTDDDGRSVPASMTVREMLRRSSNTGMALLAQEVIGTEAFAEGIARYGIGQLTGIDFPGEVEGIVKTPEEYDGATLGSMGFGQGLAIPMVQMVRAYSAVANGGVPTTPHFLVTKGDEEASWAQQDRVISADTAAAEASMMQTVVDEGTAKNARIDGYQIAAKTGTGEQAAEGGGYASASFLGSLCGFVNVQDPEALVYVGLNGIPHLASDSSAHVFKEIMTQTISIMGISPVS
ncbi:peptidoglycan glycosyltransferase [Olsenella sp. An290]|nr:peptidoglycan glycosyltransferase [Olsenella sp. An290]